MLLTRKAKQRTWEAHPNDFWVFSKMADRSLPGPLHFPRWRPESNFPPRQGTVVDVKIPTRIELHEVKFPWVARPPILGQTIDRCITEDPGAAFCSVTILEISVVCDF